MLRNVENRKKDAEQAKVTDASGTENSKKLQKETVFKFLMFVMQIRERKDKNLKNFTQ